MSKSKHLKAIWFSWVGCSPFSKTRASLGQLGNSTQSQDSSKSLLVILVQLQHALLTKGLVAEQARKTH